jgi:uncharacterized protein
MLVLVGLMIGFALGVAGAGGSIVAVPALVLALDLRPQDAMGISLGAVSAAAMVGVVLRRHDQSPAWKVAASLAITGMATAPVGRWLANQFNEQFIVILFSLLAFYVARRMWRQAGASLDATSESTLSYTEANRGNGGPEHSVLVLLGAGVGLLAGFFGVGGGFLIVPLLRLYAGMQMERAISTSLLVIALIGSSGYLYHVLTTPRQDAWLLSVLAGASITGILVGTAVSSRLSGPRLQQAFSGFVIAIMTFMLVKTFV